MTALPAVVAALVSTFDGAQSVATVLHGASLVSVLPDKHLVVEAPVDGPGAVVDRTPLEGHGRRRFRESWVVRCMLVLLDGSSDVAALEAAAGTLVDDLDQALRDTGSTADWQVAMIAGRMEWGTVHTDAGVQVAVLFEAQGWSFS